MLTESFWITVRLEYREIFRDIAKLLRDAGGLKSTDLIEKEFNIPPEPDFGGPKKPLKLINNGIQTPGNLPLDRGVKIEDFQ